MASERGLGVFVYEEGKGVNDENDGRESAE